MHLCILHPQKMRCAKYCVRLNKLAINRRLRVAQVMKWNLSYEEEKVSQHNPMVVYFRIIMYSFTPLVSKRGAGASCSGTRASVLAVPHRQPSEVLGDGVRQGRPRFAVTSVAERLKMIVVFSFCFSQVCSLACGIVDGGRRAPRPPTRRYLRLRCRWRWRSPQYWTPPSREPPPLRWPGAQSSRRSVLMARPATSGRRRVPWPVISAGTAGRDCRRHRLRRARIDPSAARKAVAGG